MSTHITVRWPEELLERIDEARGLVPRAAWIRQACEEKLGSRTVPRERATRGGPTEPSPSCPHPKNKRTQLTPKKDRCRACGELVDR